MKNFCKLFLTVLTIVSALAICAAERPSYTAKWLEMGEDAPFQNVSSDAKDTPLKFSVGLNQYFWIITIDAADPQAGKTDAPRNIIELFFRFNKSGYYQFYGCLKEKNLRFYPHGQFSRMYPGLKNYNISYETIPGKGYRAKVLLPWEDFLWLIPGKEKMQIDFGLFRYRGRDAGQVWSGALHKPDTWGQLVIPALTVEQQTAIRRQLIIKLADNVSRAVFPVDYAERYHSNTLQNWKSNVSAEFRTLARMIANVELAEKATPELYQNTFLKMREMLRLREYVSAAPVRFTEQLPEAWAFFTSQRAGDKADFTDVQPITKTGWNGPFSFRHIQKTDEKSTSTEWRLAQFTVPADGHYYITNLASRERKADVIFEVFLSGRHLFTGNLSELPLNVKVGDAKAGDKILVAVKHPGRSASFILDFAIETMHNGIVPGKAVHVRYPGATQAVAKCHPDGSVSSGYLHRVIGHTGEIRDMISKGRMPRLFFVGDSITDGLHGSPWEKVAKFDAVNLGISGDWTQNVLWRMENGMFEDCLPEVIVLMIGTNNQAYTVEEVAAGIKAILDCVQKKSPQTQVLLLGIFPRGGKWVKGCRHDRINDIIKTYADGRRVHYMDIGHIFLDQNQVVDRKLVPDSLHPNWRGNDIWMDTIMPKLEELLKK